MFAKMSGLTRILSTVVVVALLVGLALVLIPGQQKKYVTASFPRTVSLYEGSDVRILGVPVGKVETVRPVGTDVVVTMWYDAKYKVPAAAKAVIISPAIVGDRYVQLTPVYDGGPVLAARATLSEKSTSTPLELDEIYQSIDDLTVALGPQGANSKGSLTALLDSTAKNFAGQGDQFHQTVQSLGKLTGTLANNKDELFGTVREIERLVSALAANDKTVRAFNDSLASAADLLSDERADLAAALRNLGVAMAEVSSFVRENRDALSKNIKGLNVVSKVLVKQRAALDEILTDAPVALSNLFHTYNVKTGTLDTRANLGELETQLTADPGTFVCSLVHAARPKADCRAVRSLFKTLKLPGAPRTTALVDSRGNSLGNSLGNSRGNSLGNSLGNPAPADEVVQVEHIDRSLAGLVGVK